MCFAYSGSVRSVVVIVIQLGFDSLVSPCLFLLSAYFSVLNDVHFFVRFFLPAKFACGHSLKCHTVLLLNQAFKSFNTLQCACRCHGGGGGGARSHDTDCDRLISGLHTSLVAVFSQTHTTGTDQTQDNKTNRRTSDVACSFTWSAYLQCPRGASGIDLPGTHE